MIQDARPEQRLRSSSPPLDSAKQLGCRIHPENRFLRRKINRWLGVIRAHWLQCPAHRARRAVEVHSGDTECEIRAPKVWLV